MSPFSTAIDGGFGGVLRGKDGFYLSALLHVMSTNSLRTPFGTFLLRSFPLQEELLSNSLLIRYNHESYRPIPGSGIAKHFGAWFALL